MKQPIRRLALSALSISLMLALVACGNKESNTTATQVAVKVGSEEISVHQINQVLSRTNTAGATPQAVQAMSREVLEKLIDQQLAVDQALDAKLNRTPEVVAQIEAARREILARAYAQQLAGTLPKPSAEEVKKYYAEHPQLFSERRIYNVQELVVPATPGVAEQLRGFASTGKTVEEAAAWLKSKDIKFGGGAATRAAEQIPLEMLAQVHALKDGQSLVMESPQAVTMLRVASSQSQPVPEAAALPRIEQFLNNKRAGEAVAANLKELRAKTTITYMGEFTKPTATPAAPAAAAAPTAPAAQAADTSKNMAPALINSEKSAIEKGVAGLK